MPELTALENGHTNPISDPQCQSFGLQSQIFISPPIYSNRSEFFRKHLTYYRLHVCYFLTICFIGSIILYLTPKRQSMKVRYIDALFNVVSVTTVTGLVTLNPEGLSPFDGVLLMLLMFLGSQIFTSLVPLYARRYVFHRHIMKMEAEYREAKAAGLPDNDVEAENIKLNAIVPVAENGTQSQAKAQAVLKKSHENSVKVFFTGTLKKIWGRRLLKKSHEHLRTREEIQRQGTLGDISDPIQKLYLEYDASVLLSRLVIIYFLGVQLVGFIIALICILASPQNIHTLNSKNLNPVLFSSFTAPSMFANAGFSLANENLIAVRQNSVLLLWLSLLILLGNTMYAPCLRGIIFLLHRYSKGKTKLAYEFLLVDPRRCYTHLFPHDQTMWLIYTIIAFNFVECFFFFVLDWNSVALHGILPVHKITMGIFQSISTRNAGANVVNLGDLSPSMLILYVGLMYVAVYPVYLSRQNTRVKEDKPSGKKGNKYKQVAIQSQKLLARDSAYLFIAVFLIGLCEKKQIQKDGLNFSIFNIIFEVISGYGNVGLSVGYNCSLRKNSNEQCTDVPWSLSGKFSTLAKLLVIVVMVLGRHRGLPENIDLAVTMPRRAASFASMASMPSISLFEHPSMPSRPPISKHLSMPNLPSISKHLSMPSLPSIFKHPSILVSKLESKLKSQFHDAT